MALKILLADDSVTTQNLGKKILSDAGYEVVAVSNGAAAVKKIASEKPSIIILDVYMPGYNGLEVCEKVRSNPETAATPVLLTVGKMEPYNADDGNRVKADGVLIKPFEASDLLATMERFAKKLQPAAPPPGEKTQKIVAVVVEDDETYAAWKTEAPEHEEPAQRPMEMSAEAGSAPAFGFEEPAAPPPPAPAFAVSSGAAAAAPAMEVAAAPAFEIPTAAPAPVFEVPAAEAAPAFDLTTPPAEEAPAFDLSAPPAEAASAFDLSLTTEPAATVDLSEAPTAQFAAPPELEYNAAAPVEVSVAPAAEFETTALSPAPEVAIQQDSALVTNAEDMAQFATKFGVENPEPIPVGVAQPEVVPEEQIVATIPDLTVETSYEATQRMEALQEPEAQPVEVMAEEAPATVLMTPPVEEAPATVLMTPPVEEAPATLMSPPVEEPAAETAPAVEAALEPVPEPVAEVVPAPVHIAPEEEHFVPSASAMSLEEEMRRAFSHLPAPAATAPPLPEGVVEAAPGMEMVPTVAAATGIDEEKVAVALERVVDRFKSQLVTEILRELKKS